MITSEEKKILKESLDLTITTISNSIMKTQEADVKIKAREFLKKHIDLSEKVDTFEVLNPKKIN